MRAFTVDKAVVKSILARAIRKLSRLKDSLRKGDEGDALQIVAKAATTARDLRTTLDPILGNAFADMCGFSRETVALVARDTAPGGRLGAPLPPHHDLPENILGEPVDGGGLPLEENCKMLADKLSLSRRQTEILVSELRNALVPAAISDERVPRGLSRVLGLCEALAKRIER